MPLLPDLHAYLHNSSLLIQAYPDTRVTTKYSLPRKPNSKSKSQSPSKRSQKAAANTEGTDGPTSDIQGQTQQREKREPSATLTLKTFHPGSGICLKYQTDKAQEVGRLIAGLGKLAKGEVIEMPSASSASAAAQADRDAMDVDSGPVLAPKVEDKVMTGTPVGQQTQQQGSGGAKKKKKGKK